MLNHIFQSIGTNNTVNSFVEKEPLSFQKQRKRGATMERNQTITETKKLWNGKN